MNQVRDDDLNQQLLNPWLDDWLGGVHGKRMWLDEARGNAFTLRRLPSSWSCVCDG